MGRKVKCQVTGEYGNSDNFFKASNGKYYKTKEIYSNWKLQSEYRQKIINELNDIFCPKRGMKLPTVTYKKISEYNNMYDSLYDTVVGCRSNIEWSLKNKNFTSENGKMCYAFAIIENNFNDYLKANVRKRKEKEKVYEYGDEEFKETHVTTKKDVSGLLGDI